jgi:chromosome segregation ATPase
MKGHASMNIAQQIRSATSSTNPAEDVAHIDRRLEEIATEITFAQADAQASQVRRTHADAAVAKLTEQAARGALKDPQALAEALRQQRDVASRPDNSAQIRDLQEEITTLQGRRQQLEAQIRVDAYNVALLAYAKACAPLRSLGQAVRDAAPGAAVLITTQNSPGLIGADIVIGGAVIDVPNP